MIFSSTTTKRFYICVYFVITSPRLQNAVFHLLRSKRFEEWMGSASHQQARRQEPLAYIVKVQHQWERRIMKSLNSMSSDLGLCLAKPRCQEEQDEIASKWSELSTLDIDLALFRPVYAPKDFLEIITQVSSPNLIATTASNNSDDGGGGGGGGGGGLDVGGGSVGEAAATSGATTTKPSWGLVAIPLTVPTLDQLRDKFCEIARWGNVRDKIKTLNSKYEITYLSGASLTLASTLWPRRSTTPRSPWRRRGTTWARRSSWPTTLRCRRSS